MIVGKIIPFVLIGIVQLTLLVLMMGWLFGIHPQGSLAALYLLTGLFIAAVLGLGILISTIAQTQMQASQMALMLMLPFVFLSGFVFPIGGMPTIFQWLTRIVPANYAIQILRGIVLRGASLARTARTDLLVERLYSWHHRPGGDAIQENGGMMIMMTTTLKTLADVTGTRSRDDWRQSVQLRAAAPGGIPGP